MTMPTPEELKQVYWKANLDTWEEPVLAGIIAVQDAVLEGAAQEAEVLYRHHRQDVHLPEGHSIGLAHWLRSFMDQP